MKLFLKKIGFDNKALLSVFSSIISIVNGVIILFVIGYYLNEIERGYYFTFLGVASIQIFFELGLNRVIVQFVSHERAFVVIEKNRIIGPEINVSRLSSLFKMVLKWYVIISILFFITLLIIGQIYFQTYSLKKYTFHWELPWIIFCIGVSSNLFLSGLLSFLQGLGKISEIAFLQIIQNLTKLFTTILILLLNGGLYSLGFSLIIMFFVGVGIMLYRYSLLFNILRKSIVSFSVSYITEIFPYQWRIAISWISGFFIFNLFNPVVFAFDGPSIASKLGYTISVLGGFQTLFGAWIFSKIPEYSLLIAKNDLHGAMLKYKQTTKYTTFLFSILIILFIFSINLSSKILFNLFGFDLNKYFIETYLIFLLGITYITNNYISSAANFIRCFKEDPFLLSSIVGAIFFGFSIVFFGKYFGINGVIISYFILTIIFLPWTLIIFNKKLKQYFEKIR